MKGINRRVSGVEKVLANKPKKMHYVFTGNETTAPAQVASYLEEHPEANGPGHDLVVILTGVSRRPGDPLPEDNQRLV